MPTEEREALKVLDCVRPDESVGEKCRITFYETLFVKPEPSGDRVNRGFGFDRFVLQHRPLSLFDDVCNEIMAGVAEQK